MPMIEVRKCNDNPDIAMRRLKRTCDRNGLHKYVRAQENFVPESEKKRKDRLAAIKRAQKKTRENAQRTSNKHRQRSWKIPLDQLNKPVEDKN